VAVRFAVVLLLIGITNTPSHIRIMHELTLAMYFMLYVLFVTQAVNSVGTSGSSPALTVVAGILPGQTVARALTYSTTRPTVQEVDGSEITIAWTAPIDTGMTLYYNHCV
jgi:hypothetical protein